MEEKKPQKSIAVYYDGTCKMCTAFVDAIEDSDQNAAFTARDVASGALPEKVSRERAMTEMHVIDSAGEVYRGADAILRIMDEYKYLKFLSWIGKLPGIRSLVHAFYRFVAAHRHAIPWPSVKK